MGEEDNNEESRDNQRNGQQHSNEGIPPGNIVIQELIENLKELGESNKDDKCTDAVDTALDWEEAAACHVLGLRVVTSAYTAAAEINLVVSKSLL